MTDWLPGAWRLSAGDSADGTSILISTHTCHLLPPPARPPPGVVFCFLPPAAEPTTSLVSAELHTCRALGPEPDCSEASFQIEERNQAKGAPRIGKGHTLPTIIE